MKKSLVMMLALSGTVLVSCTQSEYVGETVQTSENEAIVFGGGTGRMTRAEIGGESAATLLGNEMLVFGSKKGEGTVYNPVFNSYTVKYNTAKTGSDDYNNGWYYVEGSQNIKYWDYSSEDYRFVAGSPVANFTFTDVTSAEVTGLGGRLNHETTVASDAKPVYIADPVVVAKANYKQPVKFSFKAVQSRVRVGIYETVPGYKITDIKFYNNDATPASSQYVTLNSATTGYFQGASGVKGTITYDWTTTPASYTFAYDAAGLTLGKYWEGGQFTSGVPAVNSASTDLYGTETSMGTTGYFAVMPTPSATAATPLTLTCDYTLTSLDGTETINVKQAKATIPADYTKWAPNTAYTYIFKITKDTNGTTGNPDDPDDPDGLFPIVFDAAVVNIVDGTQNVGTETTIATPSITVYQDGDVVENGITYVAGTVVVKAMEGTTEVTSDYTWSYVALDGTTFDYTQNYEKLGASGAATTWTSGTLTTVVADKTYVIKATKTDDSGTPADTTDDVTTTTYFVLVVGAAENGPANP
ncbi:MAG: hypothetical protein IJ148_02145 [Bacteroidaceae bacterium]|nr:hypothetical protein [Bacteroidaceae bacterium]